MEIIKIDMSKPTMGQNLVSKLKQKGIDAYILKRDGGFLDFVVTNKPKSLTKRSLLENIKTAFYSTIPAMYQLGRVYVRVK